MKALLILVLTMVLAIGSVNAQIIINEIDYDQPGNDTGEWVELANLGGTAQLLDGYTLDIVNQTCTIQFSMDLTGLVIPANGFLVLGNHMLTAMPFPGASNQLQNGGDDGVALWDGATFVDAIIYEDFDGDNACMFPGTDATDIAGNDEVGTIAFYGGSWGFTNNPTPGASNVTPVAVETLSFSKIKSMYR